MDSDDDDDDDNDDDDDGDDDYDDYWRGTTDRALERYFWIQHSIGQGQNTLST